MGLFEWVFGKPHNRLDDIEDEPIPEKEIIKQGGRYSGILLNRSDGSGTDAIYNINGRLVKSADHPLDKSETETETKDE